jgi:hypothetical protein
LDICKGYGYIDTGGGTTRVIWRQEERPLELCTVETGRRTINRHEVSLKEEVEKLSTPFLRTMSGWATPLLHVDMSRCKGGGDGMCPPPPAYSQEVESISRIGKREGGREHESMFRATGRGALIRAEYERSWKNIVTLQ